MQRYELNRETQSVEMIKNEANEGYFEYHNYERKFIQPAYV